MPQPATQKRTPLGIEPFWEKPSVDPPLKWEKWQMQAKLSLLAKEIINLDTLLEPKPETVQLPLESIYENTITGSSAESERERLARNAQLKMKWKKLLPETNGDHGGDKPWAQADRKTVSMLYLSSGTEGRRIVFSRKPHLKMDILTTGELWNIMEATFIRQRNITFDRYMLLTTKQSKGESIEHFFWRNYPRIVNSEAKRTLWLETCYCKHTTRNSWTSLSSLFGHKYGTRTKKPTANHKFATRIAC